MARQPTINGTKATSIYSGLQQLTGEDHTRLFQAIYTIKSDPDGCKDTLIKMLQTRGQIELVLNALRYGDHDRADELIQKFIRKGSNNDQPTTTTGSTTHTPNKTTSSTTRSA